MAQGKKATAAEIKNMQKVALKNMTQDEDGNIVVNKSAVSRETGFERNTIKKYTEEDENFRNVSQASINACMAEVEAYLPNIGKLIGKKTKLIMENEELLPAADIRGIAGASDAYIKQLQLLAGKPTEVVSGQIEVKKFDEW